MQPPGYDLLPDLSQPGQHILTKDLRWELFLKIFSRRIDIGNLGVEYL